MKIMAKTSEELYNEIKELEKKVLKIKLISKEQAIGKTIESIHTEDIEFWDSKPGLLIVFTDGTALFKEGEYWTTYLGFIYRSRWDDHRQEGSAYIGEEGRFFIDLGDNEEGYPKYVDIDILDQILKKAKEFEEARHQETIKNEIQEHLDKIAKLKDCL